MFSNLLLAIALALVPTPKITETPLSCEQKLFIQYHCLGTSLDAVPTLTGAYIPSIGKSFKFGQDPTSCPGCSPGVTFTVLDQSDPSLIITTQANPTSFASEGECICLPLCQMAAPETTCRVGYILQIYVPEGQGLFRKLYGGESTLVATGPTMYYHIYDKDVSCGLSDLQSPEFGLTESGSNPKWIIFTYRGFCSSCNGYCPF